MPELPEVETVRRGLAKAMEGRRIETVLLRRPDLRTPFPPDFAERIAGRRVDTVGRRAKYLLARLEGGDIILMHLGMSGRFAVLPPGRPAQVLGEFYYEEEAPIPESPPGKHDHVEFRLEGGIRIVFTDPRRFGLMDVTGEAALEEHPLIKGLGPEPLGNTFDADYLDGVLAGKRAPLKAALSDQRLVAGLGNIYVCEALWRSRLSPMRISSTLEGSRGRKRREDLVAAVRTVLLEAIEAGGSTLNDHRTTDGQEGAFQQRFCVYDREGEPCLREGCGGTVERIVQAGRSTYLCGRCQR
jgi:formamidopyrimidine-DNA glycosylase